MLERRITLLLAATALVVAAFGSTPLGHAAGDLVLGKNSVGTTQLKKNAVTGNKIAKYAVGGAKIAKGAGTGAKVKDGSLLAADFGPGQLPAGPQGPTGDPGSQGLPGASGLQGTKGDKGDPGLKGPKGAQGLQGSKGSKGDPGDPGGVGISAYERVAGPWTNIAKGTAATASVTCPAGKKALGGGIQTSSPQLIDLVIIYDVPVSDTGWTVRAWHLGALDPTGGLRVWAMCANVAP